MGEIMIENINEFVRIVKEGSPFEVANDVIVEVLRDGEWTFHSGFNSLSDDYAFTNARESALRAGKVLDITT